MLPNRYLMWLLPIVAAINVFHPLFHALEGGTLDAAIAYLNALVSQGGFYVTNNQAQH